MGWGMLKTYCGRKIKTLYEKYRSSHNYVFKSSTRTVNVLFDVYRQYKINSKKHKKLNILKSK